MKSIYKCRVCNSYVEEQAHCGVPAKLLLPGDKRVALSKLLSYILRHDPHSIGLRVDREGWADLEELVEGIKTKWMNKHLYEWLTAEHVLAVATLDPKGRFEVRDGRIRARYGHSRSLGVAISYSVDEESTTLYHGTSASSLTSILREGLKPMKRVYVHLTLNPREACETGRRHGSSPVLLVVSADCLRRRGIRVYIASKTIRLAEYVPVECIEEVESCSEILRGPGIR